MRRWRTTKHENRAGVQIGRTEYKALSSIFKAEELSGVGHDLEPVVTAPRGASQ